MPCSSFVRKTAGVTKCAVSFLELVADTSATATFSLVLSFFALALSILTFLALSFASISSFIALFLRPPAILASLRRIETLLVEESLIIDTQAILFLAVHALLPFVFPLCFFLLLLLLLLILLVLLLCLLIFSRCLLLLAFLGLLLRWISSGSALLLCWMNLLGRLFLLAFLLGLLLWERLVLAYFLNTCFFLDLCPLFLGFLGFLLL